MKNERTKYSLKKFKSGTIGDIHLGIGDRKITVSLGYRVDPASK
jgi:hypothetical protein